MNRRRSAVRAIERGLQVDPLNQDLLELKEEIGSRKSPVLPFLARTNPINHLLGRIRFEATKIPSA